MKKTALFLILIVAIAAFLRLWNITSAPPGLYPDEAINGNNAVEALEKKDFKVFYPENNGREGLFINIVAGSIKIFGNKPWAVRLPSAVFGILTVIGVFFLTRELFRENHKPQNTNYKQIQNLNAQNTTKVGIWNLEFGISHGEVIALLASFFLATSFWHINFSRIGFRAIIAPLFLVWGFYFLWRVSRSDASKNQKLFSALAGGIIFGIGFHSYIAYRIMPFLLILPLIKWWKSPGFRYYFVIFAAAAIVAALPLGFYFLEHPADFFGRTSQISIADSSSPLKTIGNNFLKTLGMFWIKGDYNWRHNLAGAPQLWRPIGVLFALGIIISIFRFINSQFSRLNFQSNPDEKLKIRNKNILPETVLFSWLIIGLIPVIVSNEGLPHALRSIMVIPPAMIISALGLDWIIVMAQKWFSRQKEKRPQFIKKINRIEKEAIILLFIFLAGAAINGFNQYFFRWAPNPYVYNAFSGNYVRIGKVINSLPKETRKYVIINASGVLVKNIPMPAQTVMFITQTYSAKQQNEKKIFYVTESNLDAFAKTIEAKQNIAITMLESDIFLARKLEQTAPGLKFENKDGILLGFK